MNWLFDYLPDFYKKFFQDKDLLLEVWKGYGQKFEDLYNSLAEVALSVSLPNTPYLHRIYYYKFTFDKSTWVDENKFKIDPRIVKIEKLSEKADPQRADFFLEEGKDYRILIDVFGNKYLQFIRTSRIKIQVTYQVPFTDFPLIQKGTKFKAPDGSYVEIISSQQGEEIDNQNVYLIGYRLVEGETYNPLADGTTLTIPDSYASIMQNVVVNKDFGEESYLFRLGQNPIPRFLFAEKVYLDTKIIDHNFGAFIDFENKRDKEDLYALDRVLQGLEDPESYQFKTKYSNLRIETVNGEQVIQHDSDRIIRELELYKVRVNALWFALWNGPSEFNLNVAASIFMGLPISEIEGFVRDIYQDYLNRWVVEITNNEIVKKYTLPRGITPDVEKGQPVALFQPLAPNAARIYDQFIDEKKFKDTMLDLYEIVLQDTIEDCGARFDDGLYFDSEEPCEVLFFDECDPGEKTTCYFEDDKQKMGVYGEIIDPHIVDYQYLEGYLEPGIPDTIVSEMLVIILPHGSVYGFVQSLDFNTRFVRIKLKEKVLKPLDDKVYIGKDIFGQLYTIERPVDCDKTATCSIVLEDGQPSPNFPDNFYENLRYLFMVDILGGITMIDEDYRGLRDFLYKIKPAYAHFLINLILPAEEEFTMDVDTELQTQICDMYSEKPLFFDDYLPPDYDPANEYTDPELNFETALDKRGLFFDDPRWCNPNRFDSGDGHLMDDAQVQSLVELGDLWIFSDDLPSL